MYVLGMDTSNYTTSACVLDVETGEIVSESRKLLPVPQGSKGLRQSEALFWHVQQIPEIMARITQNLPSRSQQYPLSWGILAVSVRPRPFSASYMPVFTAGESWMTSLATMLGVPLVRTSHQEGHIAAAEHFTETSPLQTREFHIAVHISGGTSDVLLVRPNRFGYFIDTIGEGLDLHAGQFIDAVGVQLGLPFPAGPSLEKLANRCESTDFRIPSRVLGAQMSFSGPASAALRAIAAGVNPAAVAFAVEQCIANSVVKAIHHAFGKHPEVQDAVIAGGVASNHHIQNRILQRLRIVAPKLRVRFAPPKYSTDNALGVAAIGRRYLVEK